jgi:SAM-dependent methyltransferase
MRCLLCGSSRTVALPALPAAMLSDGRILPRALAKKSCAVCGDCSHLHEPDTEEIARWYSQEYGLPVAAPASDRARAVLYGGWIASFVRPTNPLSVLEVGSGSGALLAYLADVFPNASLVGCEPSARAEISAIGARAVLYRGGLEAIPRDRAFDVALSVNVIEHIADAKSFLRDILHRLRPDGTIVVVCPDGETPNFELLFVDHLHSLVPHSIVMLAEELGIKLVWTAPAPAQLGRFRAYCLSRSGTPVTLAAQFGDALAVRRASYLRTWSTLDDVLTTRIGSARALIFGAGQMAALLRAYAPRTWARVDAMVVDDPAEAWPLGKPAIAYDKVGSRDADVVIATSPSSQARIAERLASDGYRFVRFDDIVQQ